MSVLHVLPNLEMFLFLPVKIETLFLRSPDSGPSYLKGLAMLRFNVFFSHYVPVLMPLPVHIIHIFRKYG